jgi:hypothetical protein
MYMHMQRMLHGLYNISMSSKQAALWCSKRPDDKVSLCHVTLLTPPCHPHVYLPLCPCSNHLDTPQHTATLLSMLRMAQQMALAEAELQTQLQQGDLQQEQMEELLAQQESHHAPHLPASLIAVEAEMERTRMRTLAAAQQIVPPALTLLQFASPKHAIHSDPEAPQGLDHIKGLLQLFEQLHEEASQQGRGTWQFVAMTPSLVSSSSSNHDAGHSATLTHMLLNPLHHAVETTPHSSTCIWH